MQQTLFKGYIGFESDHDCTGEDCHICQCIDVCGDILNSAFDIRTITTSAVHLFERDGGHHAQEVLYVLVGVLHVCQSVSESDFGLSGE